MYVEGPRQRLDQGVSASTAATASCMAEVGSSISTARSLSMDSLVRGMSLLLRARRRRRLRRRLGRRLRRLLVVRRLGVLGRQFVLLGVLRLVEPVDLLVEVVVGAHLDHG